MCIKDLKDKMIILGKNKDFSRETKTHEAEHPVPGLETLLSYTKETVSYRKC